MDRRRRRSSQKNPYVLESALVSPQQQQQLRLMIMCIMLLVVYSSVNGQTVAQLEYDYYHATCPEAERIVRDTMVQIVGNDTRVPAQLLRLMFHDCFIQGCDASLLLDDSRGNKSHMTERDAIPNKTLLGFHHIDLIKQELETKCPGLVSCADIIVLAVRDGIVLFGGPYYPVLTGRKDSLQSFHDTANAEIPAPDDDIRHILRLFAARGFNERETVSLFGAHSIGKIGCGFLYNRIFNFNSTNQPDPSIPPDFLSQIKTLCRTTTTITNSTSPPTSASLSSANFPRHARSLRQKSHHPRSRWEAEFNEALASTSIESGNLFDSHYFENLTMGHGVLFADQQLMAHPRTAELVRALASDEGSTFRREFVRVMIKMANLGVLTGAQGEVRKKCSLPNN